MPQISFMDRTFAGKQAIEKLDSNEPVIPGSTFTAKSLATAIDKDSFNGGKSFQANDGVLSVYEMDFNKGIGSFAEREALKQDLMGPIGSFADKFIFGPLYAAIKPLFR